MNAPDWYNLLAVERGQPEGWQWYRLQGIGDGRENGAVLLKGGVPNGTFKSGPRKGEINWAKATHVAEVVITFADIGNRCMRWEVETGSCFNCGGDGSETAGWSAEAGHEARKCSRCNGTGKAVSK